MARTTPPGRRADILAAARAEFAGKGYAGARLEDVARRAGISKAALYLQFADKAALFRELVDWLLEGELPAAMPAAIAEGSAADQLRFLIEAGMARLASGDISFLPRLIIGESGNFPGLARDYHDRAIRRVLGTIEAILARGIARGEFRPMDVGLAARSVAGGVIFAAIWKTVFEPAGAAPLDLGAMARSHADVLLEGLLA